MKFIISLFTIFFLLSCQTTSKTLHFTPNDTTRTYIQCFTTVSVGPLWYKTKDTTVCALRITKDVVVPVITKMYRDTMYYIPYDSVIKVNDTLRIKSVLFLPIPKEWVLQDFDKHL